MFALLSNLFVFILFLLNMVFTTITSLFTGGGLYTFSSGAQLPVMTVCSASSEVEAYAEPWAAFSNLTFGEETAELYLNAARANTLYAEPGERLDVLMEQESDCELLSWFDGETAYVDLFRYDGYEASLVEEYDDYAAVNRFGVLQMTADCPEEEGSYLLMVRENYNKGGLLHVVYLQVEANSEPPVYEKPPVTGFREAIAAGYVVVMDDGVYNTEELDWFISDWFSGEDSTVYFIKEGNQGKPIVTQMSSYRGRIYAFNDYEAIGGEVFAKEYRSIGYDYDGEQKRYYVEDDDGESYLLFEVYETAELYGDEFEGTVAALTPKEDGISLLVHGEDEFGEFYINFFVWEGTDVIRAGMPFPMSDIQPGDTVYIVADPYYVTEVPNTFGAAVVEVLTSPHDA